MSSRRVDIIIVGAGFAGAIMAMIARRQGFSVTLLERGQHPRFAIGESSTPLANLLLEELAEEFDLPFLRPFSKWGTWQQQHPEIACGLKRGFTFYHHELGRPFPRDPATARRRQLMVGASPNERIADTHWYRADFDHHLVRQAEALGVAYCANTTVHGVREDEQGVHVEATHAGKPLALTADFLIDASGPRGCLHRALSLRERPLAGFPATQGLFTHFTGVAPLAEHFTPGEPPYPPEQAAVHHVFDGGWVWVLKFNNGITSAGAAVTDSVAEKLRLRDGEAGWQNLLRELPSLSATFVAARPLRPFMWQPRISFQSARIAGRRWALLPSAAGVIDPLLSTGFPLTLLGIQRLARLLPHVRTPAFADGVATYAEQTTREFAATARLVGALYSRMNRFDEFKELSLLYFAAASYAETARRLGKSELVRSFLLCADPVFGPELRELTELLPGDPLLASRVRAAIAPWDLAGLTDAQRDPWYPALTADLLRHASKLGATEAEVRAMLSRIGAAPV